MNKLIILIAAMAISSYSVAALHIRDLDGNLANGHEGVYDDVLDITWLADGNLAESISFGIEPIYEDGRMSWENAEAYVAAMNSSNNGSGYLGITSWRQPTVAPVDGVSFNLELHYDGGTDVGVWISGPIDPIYNPNGQSAGFTGSELAYHYYNNFEAIGVCNGVGNVIGDCFGLAGSGIDSTRNTENLDLFENLAQDFYWTGTQPTPNSAFFLEVTIGAQDYAPALSNPDSLADFSVWPVFDGDVNAVPVPAGIWLFATALGSLAVLRNHLK